MVLLMLCRVKWLLRCCCVVVNVVVVDVVDVVVVFCYDLVMWGTL